MNDAFNSGFTMKVMRKDVKLASQFLSDGAALPIVDKITSIWAESEEQVDDALDFNATVEFHPTVQ